MKLRLCKRAYVRERGEERSGVRGRQKERESGSKLFALIIYFIMCEQNTHFQPEKEKSMHINIKQIRSLRHRNTLFNWCKCWQIFKCLCACVSPFPLWKTKSNQIRLLQYSICVMCLIAFVITFGSTWLSFDTFAIFIISKSK